MTALAHPTADPLLSMALSIRAGDMPKADHPCYDDSEWTKAADYALDTGDTSELAFMHKREADLDSFNAWQSAARTDREAERREFTDFDDWREGRV